MKPLLVGLGALLAAGACAGEGADPGVEGPGLSAECPAPTTVYLNRRGGVFQNDFVTDSVEDLIEIGTPGELVTFAPWPGDDEQWGTAVTCLEDLAADFHIEITDVDPGAVDHIEILVVGDELPGGGSTRADFVCPRNERAIGVVSTEGGPCPGGVGFKACYLAGEVLGLLTGLRRVPSNRGDIMDPSPCGGVYTSVEQACSSFCRSCDRGTVERSPVQSSFDSMQREYGPACADGSAIERLGSGGPGEP